MKMFSEKHPLVTTIIPSYNRAAYIRKTVDSVLIQDYPNIELIVVDDGSSDGTFEILKEYGAADKLKLMTHENHKNKGQSASLNLGLKAASGKYIAVLDSDDLFLPGKIGKQVEYLEAHPDVGLVYGMGEAVDSNGNWLYDIHSNDHIELNDPNLVLLDCYFLLPQNSLVRKKIYDETGGFNESLRAGQDHDMLIRIAETTKLAFIPIKLFQYRRHEQSISKTGQRTRWINGFDILERANERYPYRQSTVRKRRAVLNFRMALVNWKDKKYAAALVNLLVAGLLDPVRAVKVLALQEKIQ